MKRRRPEDRRVDLDALEARPQLLERLLDAAGDVERVGPRELLDDEHDARAVVDDGVAEQRLVVQRRGSATSRQRDLLAVCALERRRCARSSAVTIVGDVLDDEPLVGGVDEAARADDVAVA